MPAGGASRAFFTSGFWLPISQIPSQREQRKGYTLKHWPPFFKRGSRGETASTQRHGNQRANAAEG